MRCKKKSPLRLALAKWQLYLLILPAIIYVFIFSYIPMYGVLIAFKNYNPGLGIWGSPWVGLEHFVRFLEYPKFWSIFSNTLLLSLYSLAPFPITIIFALLLNELTNIRFKKAVQMISYMPHFFSTVVMCSIILLFTDRSTNATDKSPALRNGEVVIPAASAEYKEYLSIMKTYYDEELISKDFFTMDSTEVQAIAAEKQHVAMSTVAYLVLPEAGDFKEYVATNPLTSDVNSEKVWPVNTRYSIGQFSVSASCEYPEIAVRFGDFFFSDTGCIYKWSGPMEGSDDTLGMVTGWFVEQNDDGSYTFDVRDVRDGRYDNRWVYYVSAIIPSGSICSLGNCTISFFEDQATGYMNNVKFAGIEWKRPLSLDDGDQNFRATQLEYQADYAQEGYPGITYFTEEQNARISDLKTVIDSYIETETARFITGVRPLDEFDSYLEELEKLGLSEYLGFYEDYYSQIK